MIKIINFLSIRGKRLFKLDHSLRKQKETRRRKVDTW